MESIIFVIYSLRETPIKIGIISCKEYGCNGKKHVVRLCKITVDAEGYTIDITDIGFMEQGPCDKSCGRQEIGSFVYPPPSMVFGDCEPAKDDSNG